MSIELAPTISGAPARSWKPYPVYSGVKWMGKLQAQDRKALVIFQTGLTGLIGYVLSFNPVHPVILSRIKKPQMNADERRYLPIRGFIEELNKRTHRKGRKERKAQQQKSLRSGTGIAPRRRTRMTRIRRIFTDTLIRAYPCHPCNPCSIAFTLEEKISDQRYFSTTTQQEAAI